MLHILGATMRRLAADAHAAADALDRISAVPTITMTAAPSDAALADSLRRNLHAETMTEIEKRLERKFVRKTGV